MAEVKYLRSLITAISTIATGLGIRVADGSELQKYKFNEANIYTPGYKRSEDTMVGDGKPFKRKGKIQEWEGRDVQYAGIINTTSTFKCARWFLGGTIPTPTTVAGQVKDYLIYPKTAGATPMLNNCVQVLGEKDFLSANCYLNTFQFSQQKKNEPTFSCNGGNNGDWSTLEAEGIDTADILAVQSYFRMDPNATKVTFTDGTTNFDFAGEHRLINVDGTLNQNVEIEGLPGDDYIDGNAKCQGSVQGSIRVGVHSGQITVKIYPGTDKVEFESYKSNTTITNLKILFKTCETIATGYHNEIEIVIPVAEMSVATDSEDGKDAYTLTFEPIEGDATTGHLFWARIRALNNTNLT